MKSLDTLLGTSDVEPLLPIHARLQELMLKRNLKGIALALLLWIGLSIVALSIYSKNQKYRVSFFDRQERNEEVDGVAGGHQRSQKGQKGHVVCLA